MAPTPPRPPLRLPAPALLLLVVVVTLTLNRPLWPRPALALALALAPSLPARPRPRPPPRGAAVRLRASTGAGDGDGNRVARVAFVSGSAPSGYGRTAPEPDPTWSVVASQLARRLPNFVGTTADGADDALSAVAVPAAVVTAEDLRGADVVVALGVRGGGEEGRLAAALDGGAGGAAAVLADPSCGPGALGRRRAGEYSAGSALDEAIASVVPWSGPATGRRLLAKADTLLGRKSSEDHLFAVLFAVHGLVRPIDVVKSDINPSWEKGPVRNAREFAKMADCCGPQIQAALGDPQTKAAIDQLNAVDLRDQVGSYRVIVSNETPELEEFTLCILQQNDCFGSDAPILDRPRVPLLREWRGRPLDEKAARQILIGHLDHPEAHPDCTRGEDWSWKIVVGANPAYDAFPMQHQIFYPSGDDRRGEAEEAGGKDPHPPASPSMWYDPVFCVETLEGERIWCKRHYRVTPRRHWSATTGAGATPGAWTLTTLDNGMVSEEWWTTVAAADDLSWAVLHYSGAAKRAGQSYVGALLCSPDGMWPEDCRSGPGLERIRDAFRMCDLELWELFGGSFEDSYMWDQNYLQWKEDHPPPLERIGDISITRWRKQERGKALEAKKVVESKI